MIGATTAVAGTKGLVPAPLAGDEDKYLKGDGTWAAVQAGAGALSGLSDVDLATPTDGQALVYDGANSKWINGNVSGGGGGSGAPMKVYEGAWIATSSSSYTTQLTDALSLPAGKYLIVVCSPYSTSSGTFGIYLNINGVAVENEALVESFSASGSLFVSVQTLTTDSTVYAMPIVSASKTWDSAYLNRGYIKAIALSQPQTALIYSTEEREVGVWTDGKPLYQKTIDCGLIVNDTSPHDIPHNISDIEECVYREGVLINSGVEDHFINAHRPTTQNGTLVWVRGANIRYINTWLTGNQFRLIVTMRYTKTTDVAGSGIWTTTGEYAHHYSTSEKVIGTWIDGKPLYEKAVEYTSAIAQNSYIAIYSISGITFRGIDPSASYLIRSNGQLWSLFSAYSGDGILLYQETTGAITINNHSGVDFTGGVFCIHYTKTTD